MGKVNMSSLKGKVEKCTSTKKILDDAKMRTYARKLLDLIIDYMPDSIKPSFYEDSSVYDYISDPIPMGDGTYEVIIKFPEELLHRDSLYPDGYPDGVDNIVAILNNGYSANKNVYGYWETSKSVVSSLKERKGLHFMNMAINDFNGNYSSDYGCWARLNSKYE